MDKRVNQILLEAEKGIAFYVSTEKEGCIIISAKHELPHKVVYENYVHPPIPDGYVYLKGNWEQGYVIKKLATGDQFVWVPVGCLPADGTLNGINFNLQFGRRNFTEVNFSEKGFHEEIDPELKMQIDSVEKYGGFYLSRYNASKNADGENIKSVRGVKPISNVSYLEAIKLASSYENRDDVKSHLLYGAEYDTMLSWFIMSGMRTFDEVVTDSSSWGNYWNGVDSANEVLDNGTDGAWFTCNVSDVAGNIFEWTQEKKGKNYRVIRGGSCGEHGNEAPAANREFNPTSEHNNGEIGFRIALWLR